MREVVKKMLALRAEKAKLVGYDSYAALKLDDTMAKTPKAVFDLLEPVWEKAREKAALDEAELQRLAAASGSNEKIAAWDWRYYQERLRAEKYAFDEAELKPYLQLEKIIEACFDVATRLFGVSFVERQGIAAGIPMSASSRCATPTARCAACSSPTISRGPRSAPAPG